MQEEVESRTVTLAVNATKMTANVLKQAISKYLAHCKEKKAEKAREGPVKPCGKQSVKQLVGQIKVFPTSKSPTRISRTLSELRGSMALTSL